MDMPRRCAISKRRSDLMIDAIQNAGYKPGSDIAFALDPAASEFCESGKYNAIAGESALSSSGLIDLYERLIKAVPHRQHRGRPCRR